MDYHDKCSRPNASTEQLNLYMFVTMEGSTYEPGSESMEPDVANLQVIGLGEGVTPEEALQRMLEDKEWIKQTAFSEVLCYQLCPNAREQVRWMSLK